MFTRRALLGASTAALALSGCSFLQNQSPGQIEADVNLIANGLSSVLTALKGLGNTVPPDVLAKIQAEIDQIKAIAAQIAGVAQPGRTLLQKVAQAVQIVATLVTPFFPMAAGIAAVVQAALALVGFILQSTGGMVPATALAAPEASSMTAAQARAVLSTASAGIE